MTDKEKIREEIEKIKTVHSSVSLKESNPDVLVVQVCTNLLSFIDSLQEESVSEELEEAAKEYVNSLSSKCDKTYVAIDFKAGAKWKEQQMIANAIDAHCFGFQGAALFSFRLPADNYLVGSKIKIIVVKEN